MKNQTTSRALWETDLPHRQRQTSIRTRQLSSVKVFFFVFDWLFTFSTQNDRQWFVVQPVGVTPTTICSRWHCKDPLFILFHFFCSFSSKPPPPPTGPSAHLLLPSSPSALFQDSPSTGLCASWHGAVLCLDTWRRRKVEVGGAITVPSIIGVEHPDSFRTPFLFSVRPSVSLILNTEYLKLFPLFPLNPGQGVSAS